MSSTTIFVRANTFKFDYPLCSSNYRVLNLRNFILCSEKKLTTKTITMKIMRDNGDTSALKGTRIFGFSCSHNLLDNIAAVIPVTGELIHDTISRKYWLNTSLNSLTFTLLDDDLNEIKNDPDNKISIHMELVMEE